MSEYKNAIYKVFTGVTDDNPSGWTIMNFATSPSAIQVTDKFNNDADVTLAQYLETLYSKISEGISLSGLMGKYVEIYPGMSGPTDWVDDSILVVKNLSSGGLDGNGAGSNSYPNKYAYPTTYKINKETPITLPESYDNYDTNGSKDLIPTEYTMTNYVSRFVEDYILTKVVDGADGAMDTFKELMNIIGKDATGTSTILGKLNSHTNSINDLTHQWDTLSNSYSDLYQRLQSELKNEAFVVSWANKATYDKNGNDIAATYATTTYVNGKCSNYKNIYLGPARATNSNIPNSVLGDSANFKSGDIWIQYN